MFISKKSTSVSNIQKMVNEPNTQFYNIEENAILMVH
jgi:hypothetical protein